jgi:hypothetical protein
VKIIILILSFILLKNGIAQTTNTSDSVIQLYGVVMTADSLRAMPGVSVMVEGQNRGTITNEKGIFSIVVFKGDKVTFSSVSYKDAELKIATNLEGNQQSVLQLMVTDTVYEQIVIVRPKPTPEEFARDFVNTKVEDDDAEAARKNNEEAKKRVLLETLPVDGREAVNLALAKQAQRYYYSGQNPPQNLFSPIAWAKFIKAWKRGDFKRKN